MDITFFIEGLIIGFSIAAPVGPIGLLCMQRTLTEGRTSGFVTGLGAATADALYGCIAGFGLTVVSTFLVSQNVWFRLLGSVFLCFLGVRTFLSVPADKVASVRGRGLFKNYVSTFILTLTNPVTIISFAAIFAGLGAHKDYTSAGLLVSGVFAGSALWWFILSSIVTLFRSQIDSAKLRWINRGSGIILIGAGFIIVMSI
ncbi:MAG: LysE family transporter [Theionarchaea archaeon]|nr:LysE family transporter [Theionarchaea archaeon]